MKQELSHNIFAIQTDAGRMPGFRQNKFILIIPLFLDLNPAKIYG
jgi:hypothetical protein